MKRLAVLFLVSCLFKLSVLHAEPVVPEIEVIPWNSVPKETWPGENWPEEVLAEETLPERELTEQTRDGYRVKIEINTNGQQSYYRQPYYYARRRHHHHSHKEHSPGNLIKHKESDQSRKHRRMSANRSLHHL